MSRNQKIIFSFIILFIGIALFASEYFESKKNAVYDYMNELYYNDDIVNLDEIEEVTSPEEVIEENNNRGDNNTENYSFKEDTNKSIYIGYLSIPSIDLKRGFTTIDSKYNNVNKNIQILDASDYPDKELGNVIFASHSGNSSVSYFKNLYKLQYDDIAYIDYNGVKYTYKVVDIYQVNKTGKVEIRRNKSVSTLTLITCTKNDNTTQTVYIFELINKE